MPLPISSNSACFKARSKSSVVRKFFAFWRPGLPKTFDSWWFGLTPEFRLMLACLRTTPVASAIRQISGLCRSEIIWSDLLELVDRHRTVPLVYQNLRHHGKHVQDSIMSRLQSRFEGNMRQSLANAAELIRLYKLFQENGIPVIPLKGSVLAATPGISTCWWRSSTLSHKLLAAPLTEAVRIRACHDPLVSKLSKVSCHYMLCPDPEDRPFPLRLNIQIYRLETAYSFPEKLNIVQEILLGRDWMTQKSSSDSLFFISYITRLPLWLQRNLRRQK